MDSELLSTLSDIEKLVESFTAIENHDLLVEKIESHIQLIADFDRAELYLCDDEQTLKLFSSIGFSEKEKAEEKEWKSWLQKCIDQEKLYGKTIIRLKNRQYFIQKWLFLLS